MPGQSMPLKVIVDTNVWIDNYCGFRPGSQDAKAFFDIATKEGVELLYAVTSAKDVYCIVAAILKRMHRDRGGAVDEGVARACEATAFACIENMAEVATAVGADVSDVWLAGKLRGSHLDFEDNLVVAAGQRSEADYLVTNDVLLARHSPIPAFGAADMASRIQAMNES